MNSLLAVESQVVIDEATVGDATEVQKRAAVRAVRREDQDPGYGCGISIQFCSAACLRQFLSDAVDELERRVAAIEPEVRAARAKLVEAE